MIPGPAIGIADALPIQSPFRSSKAAGFVIGCHVRLLPNDPRNRNGVRFSLHESETP